MIQLLKLWTLLGLLVASASAATHGPYVNRAHGDVAIRSPATVQLYARQSYNVEFSWYQPAVGGNQWVASQSICLAF